MTKAPRNHVSDLRGATRLVIDATAGLTGLVEAMHANIAKKPTKLGGPIVDGAVNGVGRATAWFGEFMRATQTGQIQNYLLVAAVTVLLLLVLFFVRS